MLPNKSDVQTRLPHRASYLSDASISAYLGGIGLRGLCSLLLMCFAQVFLSGVSTGIIPW